MWRLAHARLRVTMSEEWEIPASHISHHPHPRSVGAPGDLAPLAQFSLYVHKSGLKSYSLFHSFN